MQKLISIRNANSETSSFEKTFNDDDHLSNYISLMQRKGYDVEIYNVEPKPQYREIRKANRR